jgi:hypothetical protein
VIQAICFILEATRTQTAGIPGKNSITGWWDDIEFVGRRPKAPTLYSGIIIDIDSQKQDRGSSV